MSFLDIPGSVLAFGLCIVFLLLVPVAIAGLALINTGLGRSRSAAHAFTTALCVICVAILAYFVAGLGVSGYRNIVATSSSWLQAPLVGIFSGQFSQFMAQIIGVATLLGLIFPMTYGLNWLLNRVTPYRVSADGERQGLDLHELGADAYPEFVVHADEFMPR